MDMVTVAYLHGLRLLSVLPWATNSSRRAQCDPANWNVLASTIVRSFAGNITTRLYGIDGPGRLIQRFQRRSIPIAASDASWSATPAVFNAQYDTRIILDHIDFQLSDAFFSVVSGHDDSQHERLIQRFTILAAAAWQDGSVSNEATELSNEVLFSHSDGVLCWTAVSRSIDEILAQLDRDAWPIGVQIVRSMA
jgi:hypothetical protein